MEKLSTKQWSSRFGIRAGDEIARVLAPFQSRELRLLPPVPDLPERLAGHLAILGVYCRHVEVISVSSVDNGIRCVRASLPARLHPEIEQTLVDVTGRPFHPLQESLRQSIKRMMDDDYHIAYGLITDERYSFLSAVEGSLGGGLPALEAKLRCGVRGSSFVSRQEIYTVANNLWTTLLYYAVFLAAECEDRVAALSPLTELFRQGNYPYGVVGVGQDRNGSASYPVIVQ